jgi:hypothetical protein
VTTLEGLLTAALAVALVVVLVLVLWLPRRVTRLVEAERAKAWAAFHATTAAEAAPLLTWLRGLVEWLAAFAAAQRTSAPAAPTRPQAIAPPGSAVELDPAPAVVAAGLGPRPAVKPPSTVTQRAPSSAPTLVSMQAASPPPAQRRGGTS